MDAVKISKRTREEAAMLCAIAASMPYATTWVVGSWMGSSRSANEAADDAWRAARNAASGPYIRHYVYAEAEALLRTGWSP